MRSDAELVNVIRGGDRSAYAELVRRYERTVRATALGVLDNQHAAEDAAQETFIKAYQKLGSLRDGTRFGPWLMKIARRQAIRLAKQRRPAARTMEAIAEPADPKQNGRLDDETEHLLHTVQRLPKHERLVVMLRYFDGRSVHDIARITTRPMGTVTKQLSRAHRRLRRWLEAET